MARIDNNVFEQLHRYQPVDFHGIFLVYPKCYYFNAILY